MARGGDRRPVGSRDRAGPAPWGGVVVRESYRGEGGFTRSRGDPPRSLAGRERGQGGSTQRRDEWGNSGTAGWIALG